MLETQAIETYGGIMTMARQTWKAGNMIYPLPAVWLKGNNGSNHWGIRDL